MGVVALKTWETLVSNDVIISAAQRFKVFGYNLRSIVIYFKLSVVIISTAQRFQVFGYNLRSIVIYVSIVSYFKLSIVISLILISLCVFAVP